MKKKSSVSSILVVALLMIGLTVALFVKCGQAFVSSYTRSVELMNGRDKADAQARLQEERQKDKQFAELSKSPIDARTLLSKYRANEVKADAEFKDRLVCVRGLIKNIGKDITDDPYIFFDGLDSNFGGVQCMFDSSSNPTLARLQPGQAVTVCGNVSGLMMNVIIRESRLVP